MRVYSLYLSTLTGYTQQAVFTATITGGTTLNISAVTSGSIAVNQLITLGGIVNYISALGTGTGGTGTYTLAYSTSNNSTASTYATYSINASPPKYTPISKSNLSQVKWNINWREIFGNRIGECRCRVRFISNSGNNLSWTSNTGSIRASFSSNTSNNTNNFNLGHIRPQNDYTGTNFTYLDSDSTTSNGVTIVIPDLNSDFYVTLLNSTETTMSNIPDYQIWLYFDCDDENPLDVNNSTTIANIYNPR